jgi:hypothetical protein
MCSEAKVYVEPEQVSVGQEGIFINLMGNIYPVNGLYRNAQGLHVLASEIRNSHTFSNACPYGHYSPDGSGMCNRDGCPFKKNK